MDEHLARVYLDVPYADKDTAKAGGARWDPTAKRWYDPRPAAAGHPRAELAGWAARPDVPDLLPGEDHAFGAGLFVDIVPESCWFSNVRQTALRSLARFVDCADEFGQHVDGHVLSQ